MRIGIVTGEYPPIQGGVGAYTAILAEHLHHTGQQVYLFSTQQAISHTIPLSSPLQHWGISSLPAIKTWANSHQLDIVNLQFQTAAFSMSPWPHFLPDYLSQPVVTTFHDLRYPYLFPKAGPLRAWIVRHLAQRSSGAIVTNHEDLAHLHHLQHKTLIPIGSNILSSPAQISIRQWFNLLDSDFVLAWFGLINHSKGLDVLLQSLQQLREAGIPAHLAIIGGTAGDSDTTNNTYITKFEQTISALGLQAFVHRTGYVEDDAQVAGLLRSSDVVTLPFRDGASFRRGSLMAAINYGCPIVTTTPQVNVPELIHNKNMLLVPPDSVTELSHALVKLYHNPTLRIQLGAGAAALTQQFDWHSITQAYISFFRQIKGDRA